MEDGSNETKKDGAGREIVGTFILRSGNHSQPDGKGGRIRYKPGDLVPLTAAEVAAFGHKFLTQEDYDALVKAFAAGKALEVVKAGVANRTKAAREATFVEQDSAAKERGEQLEKMRKAELDRRVTRL